MAEGSNPERIVQVVGGLIVGIPLATAVVTRMILGGGYRPSGLLFALAVFNAAVLGVGGLAAHYDYGSAVRLQRQPRLTQRSLITGASLMSLVMLAGGIALEQASFVGGPGSSTTPVAVICIPAYALMGGVFGYGIVWIVESIVKRKG
jgi:hypothetical protein